eukprot:4157656-Pleurochrysis_carterae.AAC.1
MHKIVGQQTPARLRRERSPQALTRAAESAACSSKQPIMLSIAVASARLKEQLEHEAPNGWRVEQSSNMAESE